MLPDQAVDYAFASTLWPNAGTTHAAAQIRSEAAARDSLAGWQLTLVDVVSDCVYSAGWAADVGLHNHLCVSRTGWAVQHSSPARVSFTSTSTVPCQPAGPQFRSRPHLLDLSDSMLPCTGMQCTDLRFQASQANLIPACRYLVCQVDQNSACVHASNVSIPHRFVAAE